MMPCSKSRCNESGTACDTHSSLLAMFNLYCNVFHCITQAQSQQVMVTEKEAALAALQSELDTCKAAANQIAADLAAANQIAAQRSDDVALAREELTVTQQHIEALQSEIVQLNAALEQVCMYCQSYTLFMLLHVYVYVENVASVTLCPQHQFACDPHVF